MDLGEISDMDELRTVHPQESGDKQSLRSKAVDSEQHPIETGIAALVAASSVAATGGLLAGTAGMIVGAVVGAIAGGLSGHALADLLSRYSSGACPSSVAHHPTAKSTSWQARASSGEQLDDHWTESDAERGSWRRLDETNKEILSTSSSLTEVVY